MTKKSYLVTGGTGFIGAALVTSLVERGHRIRTLDNGSRGTHRRLSSVAGQYEHVEGDVRNYDAFAAAAKGMDGVCHLAYINGTEFFYSMPETVLDVGVKGIVNAIDVCKNLSIPELIVASSSEVYQTPPTVPTSENVPLVIPDVFNPRYSYAAGKIISEIMAIHCGGKFFDRVIIFRPHNIYGPDMGWEHVIPQLVMRVKELNQQGSNPIKFPIQGTGNQTRAFCYIEDMVKALLTILEHGKHMEIYNIGTDKEVTIAELARIVGRYFKCELDLVPSDAACGGTLRRCPDTSKVRALGFEPKVTLEEGVRLTADWYDANQNLAPAKSSLVKDNYLRR